MRPADRLRSLLMRLPVITAILALVGAIGAGAHGRPPAPPAPVRERSFESRLPNTPKWRAAANLTPDAQRPEKISGRIPDLRQVAQGRSYYLGACTLAVVIDARGAVDEIHMLIPAEVAPEIRRALEAALKTWKFRPALRNGQPLAVRYFLTVNHCPYRLAPKRPE